MTRILPPCLNTLIKDQKREKKARGDGSGNDGKKEWEGREKDEEGKEEKALCKIWVESTGRFHCRTFTSSVAELARLERGKAAAIFFLRQLLSLANVDRESRDDGRGFSFMVDSDSLHDGHPSFPQRSFPCEGIPERVLLPRSKGVKS